MIRLRARSRRIRRTTWFSHESARREYMTSPAWYARRDRWFALERKHRGQVTCPWCANIVTERDDMHHTTYKRLGAEQHTDLIAMHRECHRKLHDYLDAYPARRRRIARNPYIETLRLINTVKGQR